MSMEFNGGYIKSKKHLNSFHPKHGFFLHIDDVLSWFEPDVAPTWFAMVRPLSPVPTFPCLPRALCVGPSRKAWTWARDRCRC